MPNRVGAPGGHGPRSPGNKQKAAEYRHSEQGRLARRMRLQRPDVKAYNAARRKAKRQMKAGF